jgi:hypothetical protein
MKSRGTFWFVAGIFALIVLFGSIFFSNIYLTVRRDRVLTAICIPLTGGETRLHFSAPRGHYVGWFSLTPELHKSIWEPHAKPPEVNSVSIATSDSTRSTPDVSDYGSFTFDIHKEDEFRSSELVVTTAKTIGRPLYLNIRPSF